MILREVDIDRYYFDSTVSFVDIYCAHRGVPPLAARLPLGSFSWLIKMLVHTVLCILYPAG